MDIPNFINDQSDALRKFDKKLFLQCFLREIKVSQKWMALHGFTRKQTGGCALLSLYFLNKTIHCF